MQTVAVIGGSNGGYAAAADLADRGWNVQWYVRTPEHHRTVVENERVTLRVSTHHRGRRTPGERRTVAVDRVTTDPDRAIEGADAVLVPLPTTAQAGIRDAFAPRVRDGQVIVFSPGNCGAAPFGRALDARANTPEGAVVAETPTLPYVARTSGPGEVTISLDAVRLPVGAFPGRDTDRAHDAMAALYPEAALPAADALDAALNNSNACVNATPTVLNAGAIESDEFAFNIHRQGVSESVLRVVLALDAERVRIREELGYGEPHFRQEEYYRPGEETGEHFYGANARETLTAAETFSEDPPSLDDRYLHEDIRIATVLLASLGETLDLPTPTVDSVLHLAETLTDEPYRETGRTLDALGFGDLDPDSLRAVLDGGFDAA